MLKLMKLLSPSEIPKAIAPHGPVHEATFEHNKQYVIFSTHNNPFEERLSVELFDSTGRELDRVDLSSEYASGIFSIKHVRGDGVDFTFWSEDVLSLTYHDKPRRVLFQPTGVHYAKRLAAHHIIVEGPPL